jgi:hypothetical protein
MSSFGWLFPKKKTSVIPNGITRVKISDNVFETRVSEEQREIWNSERWKKDNVTNLLAKDGFHIKDHGRSGSIYYIEQGKMCEIYFEISGVPQYDIVISFDGLRSWSLPQVAPLIPDKIKSIEIELISWLKKKRIKNDLS